MKKVLIILLVLLLIGSGIFFWSRRNNSVQNLEIRDQNLIKNNDVIPIAQAPITIVTNPIGATIKLDGNEEGKTPLSLSNLVKESYRLEIQKDGYQTIVATLFPRENKGFISLALTPITPTQSSVPIAIVSSKPTSISHSDQPSTEDMQTYLNTLLENDPNIPLALAGKVNVPLGYRFPDTFDLTKKVYLEIIKPTLEQDSLSKQMPLLARSFLFAQLRDRFYYDPQNGVIVSAEKNQFAISIINFGFFDPTHISLNQGMELVWFNQNNKACELRTDPKSPQKINQTIMPQTTSSIQLVEKGIYLFFCQGNPGPLQTVTVS
ncbi:MAG: PEGA domain-containing protein [Candidatus Abawacabacteria bacterium]|nr:PEGA domain-containing protein [Candidatus Abawacabacteria bacterium]